MASHTVALFGEHDAPLHRFLTLAMAQARRRKPPGSPLRFVDVGANLGLFSLRRALDADVVCDAFEPQPRFAALLEGNAARNGLGGKIRVHPVAVGSANGETRIAIPAGNSYIARVEPESASGTPVPLRRLDAEITPEEWAQTAVMKVDVEGFEAEVFRGAAPLLELHRPPIVFELNAGEDGPRPSELRGLLEAAGYREFHAMDRVLYPISNGIYKGANLVALAPGPEGSALRDAFGFDPRFRPRPRPQWPVVSVDF